MNINKMKDLTFPLIRKPQSDNEINLLMFTDTEKKLMTIHVIAPDGTSSSTSKKDVIIDNNQESSSLIKINKVKGNQSTKHIHRDFSFLIFEILFEFCYDLNKETHGVYRIFAKIHDLSLLSP